MPDSIDRSWYLFQPKVIEYDGDKFIPAQVIPEGVGTLFFMLALMNVVALPNITTALVFMIIIVRFRILTQRYTKVKK